MTFLQFVSSQLPNEKNNNNESIESIIHKRIIQYKKDLDKKEFTNRAFAVIEKMVSMT